ncbi:MAG: Cytoplasmic thioredoxin isoenzyme 2 [Trizodia sp. TS-e1964]|nr:MAG: Cytoplasmic thioredoxin isoenzyme 2 [Trizodia sp. TS-e1964]
MAEKKVRDLKSKAEFDAALKDPGSLMILDCFAEWCGPCRTIAPIMESLANNFSELRFYKLDIDAVPDVAQELGIRAMPTFIYFKGGKKLTQVVGADPSAIEAAIHQYKDVAVEDED